MLEAFNKLTPPSLQLTVNRDNKVKFMENFNEFMIDVRGFLCVKWDTLKHRILNLGKVINEIWCRFVCLVLISKNVWRDHCCNIMRTQKIPVINISTKKCMSYWHYFVFYLFLYPVTCSGYYDWRDVLIILLVLPKVVYRW